MCPGGVGSLGGGTLHTPQGARYAGVRWGGRCTHCVGAGPRMSGARCGHMPIALHPRHRLKEVTPVPVPVRGRGRGG